jgi:hypothetical protein
LTQISLPLKSGLFADKCRCAEGIAVGVCKKKPYHSPQQFLKAVMLNLSHYTSRAGLEGIAETHSLWGTNFLHVNDRTEFLYAWQILMQDAVRVALNHIPNHQKRPDYDLETEATQLRTEWRHSMKSSEGYSQLYITSFAQAENEDQERRGILTLWDRYTHLKGYCLQFDRNDLQHMMQLDSLRSNYVELGFGEVRYGIDQDADDYKQLRFQMEQNILFKCCGIGRI